MDEKQLITELRANNDAAYAHLLRHYGGKMLSIARKFCSNEDTAKDCVQEAFIQVFRKLDSFEGKSSLSTWLNSIVINQALMKLREEKRKAEVNIEDYLPKFDDSGHRITDSFLSGDNAEKALESAQTTKIVRDLIISLPENYCNVLLLRDIQDIDTAETARILGISESLVKTNLHRARAALKGLIEKKMIKGEIL